MSFKYHTFIFLIFINTIAHAGNYIDEDVLEEAPLEFYQQGIKHVPQGRIAYSQGLSNLLLATNGAGPCVILAARHRASRIGFLAHISFANEIDPLSWMGQKILDKLKKLIVSNNNISHPQDDVIDFYLFGGWRCCNFWLTTYSAERFIDRVDKDIKQVGNVYYQEDGCRLLSASLLIDMNTGKFYAYSVGKDPQRTFSDHPTFTISALNIFASAMFFGLTEIYSSSHPS